MYNSLGFITCFYSLALSNKLCKICKVNSYINKLFYNKTEVVRVH